MIIEISMMPHTLEEFISMPQMDLSIAENTCIMFLCAIELFINNRDEGLEAMNILRGPRPMNGFDVQFLGDRLRGKSYLPKAYFKGARPNNGYEASKPYRLEVTRDMRKQEIGYLKLFLETEGADLKRPITLRKKGESWYLWEYSSILSGIRLPKEEDPWA